MVGGDGGELRVDKVAALEGDGAARVEAAAGRYLDGIGRSAF